MCSSAIRAALRLVWMASLLAILSACAVAPARTQKPDAAAGELSPAEAVAHGDEARQSKDSARALYYYSMAVDRKPEDIDTLLKIADIYRERSDGTMALGVYRKVLTVDPENAAGLEGAGLELLARREHETARDMLVRAIARD